MKCIEKFLLTSLVLATFGAPAVVYGQNGNAFFDFEGVDPAGPQGPEGLRGQLPFGPDRYILQAVGGGISPGLLIQTAQDGDPDGGINGPFDDPMGAPGNKSAVWDNNDHFQGTPDGPTNATMGFGAGTFAANAASFSHGRVEYDIYLQAPPAGSQTFMENRLGFGGNDGFVSTANDTTVRYSFRLNSSSNRIVYDGLGGLTTDSANPLVEAVNHVVVDVLPNKTHTITLNGTLLAWNTPGGPVTALPWVDPAATGVNEMTFVTNFAGEPAPLQGLVWIDNIRIATIPEPGAAALGLIAMAGLAAFRRRAA
jgi:MYXO-CTERM domain-containing protein